MTVQLYGRGRTREINGSVYIERWIQMDSATDQIYGNSNLVPPLPGDLNILDSLVDARTLASGAPGAPLPQIYYESPSPGEYDPGITDKAWYGQAIRIRFKHVQLSGQWETLRTEAKSLVETAFPNELIYEANRRFNRPQPSDDPANPAKYVIWVIEYDSKQ